MPWCSASSLCRAAGDISRALPGPQEWLNCVGGPYAKAPQTWGYQPRTSPLTHCCLLVSLLSLPCLHLFKEGSILTGPQKLPLCALSLLCALGHVAQCSSSWARGSGPRAASSSLSTYHSYERQETLLSSGCHPALKAGIFITVSPGQACKKGSVLEK